MSEDDRNGLPESAERDPGLDRLYRAAGRDEPAARLDAAILAAAHREAGARPRVAASVLRRWQVPVSIAAVVVLSVSLVTLVQEEGGDQLVRPAPAPARPAAPPASELARAAPAPAEAGQSRPSSSAPAPPVVVPRRDAPAGVPAATGSLADDALGEAAGPATSRQGAGTAAQPDGASRPQPQPFRDEATPSASERRAATPPAAYSEDSKAGAPAAAERSAVPSASAPAPAPARSRIMAQARKEAVSADAGTPVWDGFEKEPPRKWLERIGELRRQGRVSEADAMLAEYKRRFPGHPLPAEQAGSAAPETGQ